MRANTTLLGAKVVGMWEKMNEMEIADINMSM